jgi:hypothetical protein
VHESKPLKDGAVNFAEFKQYVSLLPAAQLRENATWNWLSSASDVAGRKPHYPLIVHRCTSTSSPHPPS